MSIKKLYKKYSRDEHTKEIIVAIAKLGFIMSLAVVAPNAAGHIIKMLGWVPDYKSRTRTERTLKSLKRKNLIRYRIKRNKTQIYLTERGKLYYQKLVVDSIELPKSKKWDGLWRIITFDIPEKKRTNRKHFSKTLDIIGMYRLEKSIFIYPYECKEEILNVADTFLVSKYVRYIKALHIQNDKLARNFFKLN